MLKQYLFLIQKIPVNLIVMMIMIHLLVVMKIKYLLMTKVT